MPCSKCQKELAMDNSDRCIKCQICPECLLLNTLDTQGNCSTGCKSPQKQIKNTYAENDKTPTTSTE